MKPCSSPGSCSDGPGVESFNYLRLDAIVIFMLLTWVFLKANRNKRKRNSYQIFPAWTRPPDFFHWMTPEEPDKNSHGENITPVPSVTRLSISPVIAQFLYHCISGRTCRNKFRQVLKISSPAIWWFISEHTQGKSHSPAPHVTSCSPSWETYTFTAENTQD